MTRWVSCCPASPLDKKPASPLTVATMPLSFSPLSGSESPGSISTTVGRAREILIPNLQSWLAHITPGPIPLSLALSLRERGSPAVVAVPVKRQRRIKNTHRFVKFFLVIDKNFFLLCRRRAICGSVMSTKQNRDSGEKLCAIKPQKSHWRWVCCCSPRRHRRTSWLISKPPAS